jgi:hypothetical protein
VGFDCTNSSQLFSCDVMFHLPSANRSFMQGKAGNESLC